MKLGVSSYTYPWSIGVHDHLPEQRMDAYGLLHQAKIFGVDRVQIADNLPLDSLSDDDMSALIALSRKLNILVEVGTRRLERQHIENYLKIASFVGSPFLRVVIDDTDYEPTEAQVISEIIELLPLLEKKDMILAIENHDRFPAASLARIIEQTSRSHVGICLDTANSLGAGEGIMEVIGVLAPYTVNLHVKDITIRRLPHKMGFEVLGCVAGQGDIDIPVLIETLAPYDRCESVTLEVWSDYTGDIEETIRREVAWASESIDYLKSIM